MLLNTKYVFCFLLQLFLTHSYAMHCTALLAPCKAAPHNRYQPHPVEPEQHTKCSNRAFVILKMGIMMTETC